MSRYYFAYGSNMSEAQMRVRCPAARALGAGVLRDWRFVINNRGTASIHPAIGGEVFGVIWRVTAGCVATLDVHEGIAKRRYRRCHVPVDSLSAELCDRPVITYAGLQRGEGRPIRAYLEGTILPSARAWGLPAWYVGELAAWSEPMALGPSRRPPRAHGWRPGAIAKRSAGC